MIVKTSFDLGSREFDGDPFPFKSLWGALELKREDL